MAFSQLRVHSVASIEDEICTASTGTYKTSEDLPHELISRETLTAIGNRNFTLTSTARQPETPRRNPYQRRSRKTSMPQRISSSRKKENSSRRKNNHHFLEKHMKRCINCTSENTENSQQQGPISDNFVNKFRQTGSVADEKLPGRPSTSDDTIKGLYLNLYTSSLMLALVGGCSQVARY
ncbi:hypothetical protein TNIN_446251 [Trichonephila inaurata madagascariensis]|uniref:Uncharacterized protein n=1 Tax=Trichonephila inaurata madagascariensis TaxID=2747483 RepID=A0A8X6YYM8_9ARAC|nr:hypothetical protein TNIN_446251 [Trichonephila inaurata madagascariensis]